jgi:SAM-dependent methyltransferase
VTDRAEALRSDFDCLATLGPERWDHNAHYYPFLLRQLAPRCERILDIGCGAGAFTRLLARRAHHVTGVDLSPQMLRLAAQRAADVANVHFLVGDVLDLQYPAGSFDAITAVAVLHHLPLEPVLQRLKVWLRPGGAVVVLDLLASGYGWDLLWKVPAVATSSLLSLWWNGRLGPSREARAAWARHIKTDRYLALAETRRIAARVLPGAIVRRHLLWRYSLVWRKAFLE